MNGQQAEILDIVSAASFSDVPRVLSGPAQAFYDLLIILNCRFLPANPQI
jgi:hypothetical protein